MAFDDELVLRDGSIDLDDGEAAAVAVTINADGAYVVDLKKTGSKGLVAVLILPTAPSINYQDTLNAYIQSSDHVSADFKTIASYPTLYAFMMRVNVKAVTAFAPADVGKVLEGATTTDSGVIRWYDKALETIGGVGDILVEMQDAGDLYDNTSEAVDVTAGTGDGVVNGVAGAREPGLSYGIYIVRFQTNKRYVRGLYTASATSNWGKAQCLLTNDYPMDSRFS